MISGHNIFDAGSPYEREVAGYKQLFSSIILQAEKDKYSRDKKIKKDALQFLGSEEIEHIRKYLEL